MTPPPLFIDRRGDGPRTLVALHGLSGSHRTWDPIVDALPDDVTLLRVDLPGYADSPAPERWDLDAVCEQVVAGLDARGVSTFELVGTCSGALVALSLAQRVPQRVEALSLLEAFAWVPWYFAVFVTPVLGPVAYYSTFANPVGRWITARSLRRVGDGNTDLAEGFARIDVGVPLRYLRMVCALGDWRTFSDVRVPVRLTWGERSFAAVTDGVSRWQELWPDAPGTPIAGAGHLPVEENPDAAAAFVFAPWPAATRAASSATAP